MPSHRPAAVAALIVRDLAPLGIVPATPQETPAAHALAERLIGAGIVSAEDLAAVHARTGAGVFVTYDDGALSGILAFVLLTRAGRDAVLADAFDAVRPASAHVARPQDAVCGLYGWGVAAVAKPAARRLIEGAHIMGRNSVSHLPYYARPATAAGERLMRDRLGFVDVPGSRTGLVWAPPFNLRAAAA